MSLQDRDIRGIVTVMGDAEHQSRVESMGTALRRLSEARERRGPVGVVNPLLDAGDVPRSMATGLPRATQRRGLFSFSDRAREAANRA